MEFIAKEDPFNVTVDELLEKLHNTESKLEWWQTIRTDESYKGAPATPQTEAHVTLNFLRDALFHYLTDQADSAQHLRAMVGLMGFTPDQRKQLEKVMTDRKNKFGSLKKRLSEQRKRLGSLKSS